MKLLVLISMVVTGYARPDVSHLFNNGHKYTSTSLQIPSGSYLPTGGVVSDNGGFLDGSGSLGALDHKHVYFYASPEEEEHSYLRIHVAPSNQRNTKVIFIKAPSHGGVRPEVIAPPSVSEDKTLVYVLVKKPEHGGSITIPSNIISRPTKPEIFFIKYKNHHEAEQAIAGGLQEQPVGPNVPDLGNEHLFIRTIKDDVIRGSNGLNGIELNGNGIGLNGNGVGLNGNGIIGGSSLIGSIGGDSLTTQIGGSSFVSGGKLGSFENTLTNGNGIVGGSSLLGAVAGEKLGGLESSLGGKHGPPGASGPY